MTDPRSPVVVVTGIGLATGLGGTRERTWHALKTGASAVRRLDAPLDLAGGAGAPRCRDDSVATRGAPDPALLLALQTAREALADAGLEPGGDSLQIDPERIATVIGLSKGCVQHLSTLARSRAERYDAHWPEHYWPNSGAVAIARSARFRGPCVAPVAACATGLIAALQAAELIRRGVCDVALAGAADASLDPLVLAAFRRMGVLARVEGDPARAVRPWDRRRTGFLVGEGAAVLVLERAEHARARGVLPYVEFAGGASGADAYHATILNPDPTGLGQLIVRALRHAKVDPPEVDLVNVHGTATPSNDPLECRALREALGADADRVSCTANKSQIGHLLGAAGAVELAITCLAVRDGFVPPTLNLDDADPACDLDGTPHVGRHRPIRAALKLSIGFGGHLAAALVRRIEGDARRE